MAVSRRGSEPGRPVLDHTLRAPPKMARPESGGFRFWTLGDRLEAGFQTIGDRPEAIDPL